MELLRIYTLTTIVLALKMAAIAVVQGRARQSAGAFVNPEDAKAFKATPVPQEVDAVRRAARAWLNDLENIPIFLILAWIYVAAGLSASALALYCAVFTVARILHTIFYINGVQPWRTIVFTIGAAAMLTLMIHLFIRVVMA
jgi:glutathione S-transferase